MKSFRCSNCATLLMRAILIVARIEIKCSKCNMENTWAMGDVAGCPLPLAQGIT